METTEERLLAEYFPCSSMRALAEQRLSMGEPLAYILGEWAFYREMYYVTPDVLIPRPDTELLVERAIREIPPNGIFLDLCTGSGCVAISILASRPDLRAVAVDISERALKLARKNAVRNGVADRVTFVCDDVCRPAYAYGTGTFDALCANPPYIDSAVVDTLSPQVKREPRLALDGGEDGMDFYRAILRHYPAALKEPRYLFEIGYDQRQKIAALAGERRLSCEILRDYGQNDRVAILTNGNTEHL